MSDLCQERVGPVVLATENRDKIREFTDLFRGRVHLVALDAAGFKGSLPPEGSESYEKNASAKAACVAMALQQSAIADDSGFEVEALNHRPGVLSARYGATEGRLISAAEQRQLLLLELTNSKNRKARFVSVLAFYDISLHKAVLFRGEVQGRVAFEERGVGGFGYDALFIPDGYSETFAEMKECQKNSISHRARAAELFLRWLNKI